MQNSFKKQQALKMEASPDNYNTNKPIMTTTQHNYQSSVDTSRPFRSVKEAVAVFGERILVGSAYVSPARAEATHNRSYSWNRFSSPCSPITTETTPKPENDDIMGALKKVEAELEETKAELRMLKEREKETEVAVAALKAELHKTMSRLAEEAEAAKASAGAAEVVKREEERRRRRRELKKRMEKNTTLAQILSLGLGESDNMNMSDHFGRKDSNRKKIKPIVPLVGDFLLSSLRKGSRSHNPDLYSAPSQRFHS